MYAKDETRNIRREFWTVFGQLMKPHLSSEGMRVKWVNYPTGISALRFKMDADQKSCRIGIEIRHKDPEIRALFYEQLLETKNYLHTVSDMEWNWNQCVLLNDGTEIDHVFLELQDVNIFKKEDWPDMFAFFKIRIRLLDEWWNDIKQLFEALKD